MNVIAAGLRAMRGVAGRWGCALRFSRTIDARNVLTGADERE